MMARMNMLSARGKKPVLDLFRLTESEFKELALEILKRDFNFDFDISFARSDEDQSQIMLYVDNEDDIPDEIVMKMADVGANPYEEDDVLHYVLFQIGGGQDTYMEYGGNDEEHNISYFDVMVNSRQDLEIKLLEALAITLQGSRDDAVIQLNKLLKDVRL